MRLTKLHNSKLYKGTKFVVIALLPFMLYFVPLKWLTGPHTICLFKNIFGRDCIGCGITRAVISTLQFDFAGAFHFNKLIVIVFPLMLYLWVKALIVMAKAQ
ncbi:MAG: DUF2752 domain-containing protein [Bacteroidales bacterium]|nr:DUF2752 domain-containing protein [Bacteroidales bacterium]